MNSFFRCATLELAPSLLARVEKLLGPRGYLHKPEDLALYEYDGGVDKSRPDLVVFPQSTADVVALVKLSAEFNLPIVGRGTQALDSPAASSPEPEASSSPSRA